MTDERVARAVAGLAAASDLTAAARCLKDIGAAIGAIAPAVVDDYAADRLLTVEDGTALAAVLGWEEVFPRIWLEEKLYLVSPIGAVCRATTRPFVWQADAVARTLQAGRPRQTITWRLTPEFGIHGGITVPVHLPHARTGSVGWMARSPDVDLARALDQHEDQLRLAAYRFMDLVYARRSDPAAPMQGVAPLNEREVECLSWAGLGRTDIEIGAIIHRSPATARFHIDNAISKLGARNRTQAVAIAAQLGLIQPYDDRRKQLENSRNR